MQLQPKEHRYHLVNPIILNKGATTAFFKGLFTSLQVHWMIDTTQEILLELTTLRVPEISKYLLSVQPWLHKILYIFSDYDQWKATN